MADIILNKRIRLYALDGLRGICAAAVMIYHFYSWNGIEYFQIGKFAVYLFFVLSGFSMWYVYAPQALTAGMLRRFFTARFARLFPLYFLASLLVLFAKGIAQGSASIFNLEFLNRFLLNITFLFGVSSPGKTSDIPGGWSIGIEWVFYVCFPLLLLFTRRITTLVILLLASAVLNQIYVYSLLPNGLLLPQWVDYCHFPVFIVYFTAGILSAELYDRLPHYRARMNTPGGRFLCRLVPVLCLALIFAYPSATVEDFLAGPHFPLLILTAMLAMLSGSFLTGISQTEIAIYEFLGNISYSTYLLHFFVYKVFEMVLKHTHPIYGFGIIMPLAAVSTLALAWLSYRFFELPARNWINRKLGH